MNGVYVMQQRRSRKAEKSTSLFRAGRETPKSSFASKSNKIINVFHGQPFRLHSLAHSVDRVAGFNIRRRAKLRGRVCASVGWQKQNISAQQKRSQA
jgi:hypothetical protein